MRAVEARIKKWRGLVRWTMLAFTSPRGETVVHIVGERHSSVSRRDNLFSSWQRFVRALGGRRDGARGVGDGLERGVLLCRRPHFARGVRGGGRKGARGGGAGRRGRRDVQRRAAAAARAGPGSSATRGRWGRRATACSFVYPRAHAADKDRCAGGYGSAATISLVTALLAPVLLPQTPSHTGRSTSYTHDTAHTCRCGGSRGMYCTPPRASAGPKSAARRSDTPCAAERPRFRARAPHWRVGRGATRWQPCGHPPRARWSGRRAATQQAAAVQSGHAKGVWRGGVRQTL